MDRKNKGIRFLLSFRPGYLLRKAIKKVRMTNQFTVANISETLQLIVASANGRRANEFRENIKSVMKLKRKMPVNTNQTSLNPKYLIRFALLNSFTKFKFIA